MSQVLSTDHDLLAFRGVLARRLCAFAVDLLLMSLFGWMLAASIAVFGILTLGLGFLLFHIMPFAPFLYFTLFVATGGTPGQRVFGLAVRQDADLAPPTPAQALVWSLLLGLSFFVFAGLPFLMALVGPRRRAGHDILSGLVVIRAPQIFY
jgi:uncharacterized RDD family membrane protein YckC